MKKSLILLIAQFIIIQLFSQGIIKNYFYKSDIKKAMKCIRHEDYKKADYILNPHYFYGKILDNPKYSIMYYYAFTKANVYNGKISENTDLDSLNFYLVKVLNSLEDYDGFSALDKRKLFNKYSLNRDSLLMTVAQIEKFLYYRENQRLKQDSLKDVCDSQKKYINSIKSDSLILVCAVDNFRKYKDSLFANEKYGNFIMTFEINGADLHASLTSQYDTIVRSLGPGEYYGAIDELLQCFALPIRDLLIENVTDKTVLVDIAVYGEADGLTPKELKYENTLWGDLKNIDCLNKNSSDSIEITIITDSFIDNFQLAFLRAYNANYIIKDVITNLPPEHQSKLEFINFRTKYSALDWREINKINVGPEYRIIKVDIIIANLIQKEDLQQITGVKLKVIVDEYNNETLWKIIKNE